MPLFGSHYRLRQRHKLRLDLTQVDQPFLPPSNLPSTPTFDPPTLHLPTPEAGERTVDGTRSYPPGE